MAKSIIYWLVSSEKPPEPSDFLSPREHYVLAEKRFPKRRTEWLNGRWAAKCLLCASHLRLRAVPFKQIEIENTIEGIPYAVLNGQMLEGSLSLSHRDQVAFCAVTFEPLLYVGADIERIEPRSAEFIADYFTASEAGFICSNPLESHFLASLMWSAKEAMLKALGKGLRLDTRQVEVTEVSGSGAGWSPLGVCCALAGVDRWVVKWQRWNDYVLTLAVLSREKLPKEIGFQQINSAEIF